MDVAIDTLIEFLETAIHGILHCRQIYPSGTFVKRSKYSIPVHVSIHPGLNEYITKCLCALRPFLEKRSLKAVAVSFVDKWRRPVERFVIELSELCDVLCPCEDLLAVERSLRACCMKINMSNSLVGPLEEGCTFIIQAHTDDDVAMDVEPNSEEFPWIVSEWRTTDKTTFEIVPLKSLRTPMFKLQLLIEKMAAPPTRPNNC